MIKKILNPLKAYLLKKHPVAPACAECNQLKSIKYLCTSIPYELEIDIAILSNKIYTDEIIRNAIYPLNTNIKNVFIVNSNKDLTFKIDVGDKIINVLEKKLKMTEFELHKIDELSENYIIMKDMNKLYGCICNYFTPNWIPFLFQTNIVADRVKKIYSNKIVHEYFNYYLCKLDERIFPAKLSYAQTKTNSIDYDNFIAPLRKDVTMSCEEQFYLLHQWAYLSQRAILASAES